MTSVEEDRLPETKELEGFANVVVRASISESVAERIRIFFKRSGAVIHTLRPGELCVCREVIGEIVFQSSEHGIVIGASFIFIKVHVGDERIQCGSLRSTYRIRIRLCNEM